METGVVMFIGKTHENMLRVLANESTFSLTMLMPRSSDAFSYKSTAASGYSEYTTLYFIILYLFIIFILYIIHIILQYHIYIILQYYVCFSS